MACIVFEAEVVLGLELINLDVSFFVFLIDHFYLLQVALGSELVLPPFKKNVVSQELISFVQFFVFPIKSLQDFLICDQVHLLLMILSDNRIKLKIFNVVWKVNLAIIIFIALFLHKFIFTLIVRLLLSCPLEFTLNTLLLLVLGLLPPVSLHEQVLLRFFLAAILTVSSVFHNIFSLHVFIGKGFVFLFLRKGLIVFLEV